MQDRALFRPEKGRVVVDEETLRRKIIIRPITVQIERGLAD